MTSTRSKSLRSVYGQSIKSSYAHNSHKNDKILGFEFVPNFPENYSLTCRV